jgi:ligand-binding sensor domain-containing protein/signal transduction histidine kinase
MMFGAKYLLVIMVFLGFASPISVCASSDPLQDRLGSFRVRTWTSDDGLPQNQVSCLKQTRDGYLWIGTYFGLARLDGLGLTVFTTANTPVLENLTINSLAEDRAGVLWIGTSKGLLRYADHRFEKVPLPAGLSNVIEIVAASSGGVWLHINKSVIKFKNAAFSHAWEPKVQDAAHIVAIAEGSDGSLNVFTHDAWLQVSPDGSEARTNAVAPPSAHAWFAALLEEKSNSALVGTRDGIFRLTPNKYERVAAAEIGAKQVDRICRDQSGNLWVNVKDAGIFFKRGDHWQLLNLGDGPESGSNLSVEQDREGNLWLGTRTGLVQLRQPLVSCFSTRQGLSNNKVWSVCETSDNTICAGTESGLSFIRGDGSVETYHPLDRPDYPERLVWPASNGGVYSARNRIGLFKFHDGEERLVISAASLPGLMTSLWANQAGMLFVGGEHGIAGFPEIKPVPWEAPTKLIPVPKTFTLFQPADGSLWCGTEGMGLAHVQAETVSWLTSRDGLISDFVYCICPDGMATLWLGTDKGLARLKDGRFSSVTREQGLRENTINCMVRDNADGVWLSGQQGIYRVTFNQLDAVADGRSRSLQPFALGTADGMETPETNGGKQPAGWKARDGKLWFPTMRGVVSIDPAAVPANEAPPTILIQQIKADDKIIFGDFKRTATAPGKSELKPGHGRVLEFTYTANSFVDPRSLRFSYRLVGADDGWHEETTEQTARYINLKPGDYRFEVIGANSHNVWNRTAASFSFYLAPHFWETWTFYVLTGCGLIGLAVGIQAYRLRWQHRLMVIEQESALAAERTRIARDLHDDVGTALTGLALELDVAGQDAEQGQGSAVPGRLHNSATVTRNLAERMRQVVWTVNPKCDNVTSLVTFLEQQVSQFLRSDKVRLRLDFPDEIPDLFLGGAARYELALVVREALTNVVRHSQATEVTLSLKVEEQASLANGSLNGNSSGKTLVVKVKDNGCGIPAGKKPGNGLSNMKARLEKIGGRFEFVSAPSSGTTFCFSVPVPKHPKVI